LGERIDHWRKHAVSWSRIGSPLRPNDEDLRLNTRWIERVAPPANGPFRALILGVTPELALLPWPEGAQVYGVDRSIDMARNAWPAASLAHPGLAINGDWRLMPLPAESVSLAIGDGSYSNLDAIGDYDQLSAQITRVLRPGGHLIIRLYVRPEVKEAPESVIETLVSGKVSNFNAFKLRLMMAMAPDPDYAVRTADIFALWSSHNLDYDQISRRTGIPREIIETVDNYRGSATRYNFPPMSYLERHFAKHFDLIERYTPGYDLGERCPTLLLARR
jgi:SAM-dependent methyltransferase